MVKSFVDVGFKVNVSHCMPACAQTKPLFLRKLPQDAWFLPSNSNGAFETGKQYFCVCRVSIIQN